MASSTNPSTAAAAAGGPFQIPINLYTQNPSHAIPQSTYLIPSDWKRYQLSELINKVLQSTSSSDASIPFDFLIDDTLLRSSLEEYIRAHKNGDTESTLNVEYLESLRPPKKVAGYQQDDWVSGVSVKRKGYVLMSSYLSHLRVLPLTEPTTSTSSTLTSASQGLYTLPLPTSLGATCCEWLSPREQVENILVGAGGMDRQAHIFQLPSLDPSSSDAGSSSDAVAKEIMTLHLHTAPISSISPSADFSQVLTSSWDGTLGVFALPTLDNPLEEVHDVSAEPTSYLPGQKKRRKNAAAGGSEKEVRGEGGWRKQPEMVMRGHDGRIGGAIWDKSPSSRKIWSAGWDGSVRGWESDSGYQSVLKQGPLDRAALCIDQFNGQSGSLVTGNMDRTICFFDTRESTNLISLIINTPSPVPSISVHPTSQYSLASATYAGAIQIWDIRSPKQALFTVQKQAESAKDTHIGRLLGLDWDGEILAAGGEDGEVGVWTARGQ